MINIQADQIKTSKLWIFDLDGTLYDQKKLRYKLFRLLIHHLLTRKIKLRDIRILNTFRKQRENYKGYSSGNLNKEQYEWAAEKLHIKTEEVKHCVEYCMHFLPLSHLKSCIYPGVAELFQKLNTLNKRIAIYSDYPAERKIIALGLTAEASFCSTDTEISQLKPSGKALEIICRRFAINTKEAIFVGDRDDTDGASAREAAISFLLIDTNDARAGHFFPDLLTQVLKYHE